MVRKHFNDAPTQKGKCPHPSLKMHPARGKKRVQIYE